MAGPYFMGLFGLAIFDNICYNKSIVTIFMLTARKKASAIKNVQLHAKDSGSPEVQVSLLSKKIAELTKHLKEHKKDNHSRRGLIQMVANRRTHLKYLETSNKKRYDAVTKKLGLK
jgi:small subunit ribosomal protein S15